MSKSPKHIYELDALRGIAAMGVLLCHLHKDLWFGATGVDLFFVLSGFLISSIIFRSINQPRFFSTFYIRRSLRIFPVYYLVILIAFLLNSLRHHPLATDGLPFYLVYLQNIHMYWGQETPPVDLSLFHTWTLALEEQFYLIWPMTLFFCRGKSVIVVSFFFFFLPVFLRSLGLPGSVLLGHSDGLALGALLAIFFSQPNIAKGKAASGFLFLFFVAVILYWILWWNTYSPEGHRLGREFLGNNWAISLLSISYFGLIGYVVSNAGKISLSFLRWSWLVKLGTVSYGLYVYHLLIYETLDTFFLFRWKMENQYWMDLLKITLSISAAFISWHFFEKPILKLKERFTYTHNSETGKIILA